MANEWGCVFNALKNLINLYKISKYQVQKFSINSEILKVKQSIN